MKMLLNRVHNAQDYAKLPDIDAARVAVLSPADEEALDELGEVLCIHGLNERLGVSLLHQHFTLRRGEVMVVSVDGTSRAIVTRPTYGVDLGAISLVPVNMALMPSDSGFEVVGLEYSESDAGDELDPTKLEACLDVVAGVLTGGGLTNRFGIARQRNPLGMTDGEVLLEETMVEPRALVARPVSRDDSRHRKSTETFWAFELRERGSGDKVAGRTCYGTCKASCLSTPYGGHKTVGQHNFSHTSG